MYMGGICTAVHVRLRRGDDLPRRKESPLTTSCIDMQNSLHLRSRDRSYSYRVSSRTSNLVVLNRVIMSNNLEPPPSFEEVKDCVVEYCNAHRNRLDTQTSRDNLYREDLEITYRSRKSWGSLFGQWWIFQVDLVHAVEQDNRDDHDKDLRKRRLEMGLPGRSFTIGDLVESFGDVCVTAKRTCLVWPSFRYMDSLPSTILVKGMHFVSKT